MDLKTKIASLGIALKSSILKKKTPLAVRLQLTDRCNLRCLYCDLWKNPRDELDTTKILNLLQELKVAGTKRISLSGGEPLLREDIGDIIEFAKKLDISVSMNSNGSLVKKKISEIGSWGFWTAPQKTFAEKLQGKWVPKQAYREMTREDVEQTRRALGGIRIGRIEQIVGEYNKRVEALQQEGRKLRAEAATINTRDSAAVAAYNERVKKYGKRVESFKREAQALSTQIKKTKKYARSMGYTFEEGVVPPVTVKFIPPCPLLQISLVTVCVNAIPEASFITVASIWI